MNLHSILLIYLQEYWALKSKCMAPEGCMRPNFVTNHHACFAPAIFNYCQCNICSPANRNARHYIPRTEYIEYGTKCRLCYIGNHLQPPESLPQNPRRN